MKRILIISIICINIFPIFGNSSEKENLSFLSSLNISFITPSSLDTSFSTIIPIATNLEINYSEKYSFEVNIPFNIIFFSKVKFNENEDFKPYFTISNPQLSFSIYKKKLNSIHSFLLGGSFPIKTDEYAKKYIINDSFFRLKVGYIYREILNPVSIDFGITLSTGLPFVENDIVFVDPLSIEIPFHFIFVYNKKIASNFGTNLVIKSPSKENNKWTTSFINYSLPITAKIIYNLSNKYFSIDISKDVLSIDPIVQINFIYSLKY